MNRHLLFIALISCAFGANAQNILIKNCAENQNKNSHLFGLNLQDTKA